MEAGPGLGEYLSGNPRGTLILVWHNRLALALAALWRVGKKIPLTGLVSASGDGAVLAEVMGAFGVNTVRGSSSRRAVEATRELLAALQAGRNGVITPDGPRGPVYTVKEGVVELANAHARGLYVVGLNSSDCWKMRSWDGFMIPKPFSKLVVEIKKIETPTSSDELQGLLKAVNGN